jgi:hypothetical protein
MNNRQSLQRAPDVSGANFEIGESHQPPPREGVQ